MKPEKAALLKILSLTQQFLEDNKPVLDHVCPVCGSGSKKLIVLHGYTNASMGTRASLRCRECNRQHQLEGSSAWHRKTFLRCLGNTRGKKQSP